MLEKCMEDAVDAKFESDEEGRMRGVHAIRERHMALAEELGLTAAEAGPPIDHMVSEITRNVQGAHLSREASPRLRARTIAMGERLSSFLGYAYLLSRGIRAVRVDSTRLIRSSEEVVRVEEEEVGGSESRENDEGGMKTSGSVLSLASMDGGGGSSSTAGVTDSDRFLRAEVRLGARERTNGGAECERASAGCDVVMSQGFIAGTASGETCLLGRGGSDTSASLFAAMLSAERLEIWTDVHGMFTADPRLLPNARLLRSVSYREAQELAAMGAKVLHPRCLVPCKMAGVPVEVRNTLAPDATDITRVTPHAAEDPSVRVLAVSCRKGITMLTLSTFGMWGESGFLARVFSPFEILGISVDLIATSEYSVSLTLDHIPEGHKGEPFARLLHALQKHAHVQVRHGCAVVSVVGRRLRTALPDLGAAMEVFRDTPVLMLSQAAEDLNIAFVVDQTRADYLTKALHTTLHLDRSTPEGPFGKSFIELENPLREGTDKPKLTVPKDVQVARVAAAEVHSPDYSPKALKSGTFRPGLTAYKEEEDEGVGGGGVCEERWFEEVEYRRRLLEVGETLEKSETGAAPAAWVYNLDVVRKRAKSLRRGVKNVTSWFYAVKANDCVDVVKCMVEEGFGLECVSAAEVARVRASHPSTPVLFTPNFVAGAEYACAAKHGAELVFDSVDAVEAAAAEPGEPLRGARAAVRIDVALVDGWQSGSMDAHHAKVTTVGARQKFGCDVSDIEAIVAALRGAGAKIVGLHAHAGSGAGDCTLWARILRAVAQASSALDDTTKAGLEWIDLGGGLGVAETSPDHTLSLDTVNTHLEDAMSALAPNGLAHVALRLEPGRYCVGPAGVLLAQVTGVKTKRTRRFVGVSAGMNALIRPALYNATHAVHCLRPNLEPAPASTLAPATVVGCICETGDILSHSAKLPTDIKRGEWIIVANAGAYGATMSSTYNDRPLLPQITI